MNALVLGDAEIARLLTLDDCIAAVEDVFRAYGERRIAAPQSLGVPMEHGAIHIKTAVTEVFVAKINANFPGNPGRNNLPAIQGVIVLFDRERGTPLAIMDSARITVLRTAAASAVAAKYLSRADARTMTVVGCGNQGRAHLEAMLRVRSLERVYAFDADPARATAFARDLPVAVVSNRPLEDAVRDSEIVVTCTPSRAAILDEAHLHPGLFIAAVGADNPDKQELSPALLAAARVVPDIVEQAAVMGDLHHALAAGVMTRQNVHGELADVLCGRAAGRTTPEEVFVYDSTGTALQDAAVAAVVYGRARQR